MQQHFSLSHLQQPDLFLRLRPGKEEAVQEKLKSAGIEFKKLTDGCIALPNASKADEFIKLNEEAVVQDYSSQQVGELMGLVNPQFVRPGLRTVGTAIRRVSYMGLLRCQWWQIHYGKRYIG